MIRNEDQALQRTDDPRRAEMKTPDDVSAMVRLKALGRVVDDAHLAGLVGSRERPAHRLDPSPIMPPALLRPLAEYEAVAGGGF